MKPVRAREAVNQGDADTQGKRDPSKSLDDPRRLPLGPRGFLCDCCECRTYVTDLRGRSGREYTCDPATLNDERS